jgi:hypothetical protein
VNHEAHLLTRAPMTSRVHDLRGVDRTVRAALGVTWRWYVDKPLEGWRNNVASATRRGRSAPGWWPAPAVVTDPWGVGEVPDPYRGRNTGTVRAYPWIAATGRLPATRPAVTPVG